MCFKLHIFLNMHVSPGSQGSNRLTRPFGKAPGQRYGGCNRPSPRPPFLQFIILLVPTKPVSHTCLFLCVLCECMHVHTLQKKCTYPVGDTISRLTENVTVHFGLMPVFVHLVRSKFRCEMRIGKDSIDWRAQKKLPRNS